MSWQSVVNIFLPVVDVKKPSKEANTETPRQAYNRLSGQSRLNPEEQQMLWQLAEMLGIRE